MRSFFLVIVVPGVVVNRVTTRSQAAEAVAQVRDVLRELLDIRRGQPAEQVEFDLLRRQVVEQPSLLPEEDRDDAQFQLVELPGPQQRLRAAPAPCAMTSPSPAATRACLAHSPTSVDLALPVSSRPDTRHAGREVRSARHLLVVAGEQVGHPEVATLDAVGVGASSSRLARANQPPAWADAPTLSRPMPIQKPQRAAPAASPASAWRTSRSSAR